MPTGIIAMHRPLVEGRPRTRTEGPVSAEMKVVILAGGLGTRLAEETSVRPKPMAEIGDRPVLWHIMKIYSAHGFNEFVVCLGYKGYMLYLIHISEPTRLGMNSYAVFCLKKKTLEKL